MPRRLRLTKKQLVDVNFQFLGAYRFRVEVDDPSESGADPHVFVYNRRPADSFDPAIGSVFLAVASPGDLAEYPVGEPATTTTFPFFRLDYVELDFRATKLAEETWLAIVHEVTVLLEVLDRMDRLVPVVEVWVGALLPTDVSASASDSGSGSR